MVRTGFHSITLPDGLYRELEQFVERSNGYYVSITEVVREALRTFLRQRAAE
jgi:Arc/MetJ-type ribon-helix-helix transcriptional regulator